MTGDPPDQAARATAFLRRGTDSALVDLVAAETVFVLESFYRLDRRAVAELLRAVLAFPAIAAPAAPLLLRALAVYELHRLHFVDAYVGAAAEAAGAEVASFDRSLDRVATVRRAEP